MSEETATPPSEERDALSLDERKFRLEEKKFEFERSKSRGLGFLNSNLAVVITAIVGVGTVTVSSLQLMISNKSAKTQLEFQSRTAINQLELEREKARAQKEKDDRVFQFELTKFLADKAGEVNTDDERQIAYLRDVVFSTLPVDIGIKITKKMADNAPNQHLRSKWNDSYVNLQLSISVPLTSENIITVQYAVSKFPQLDTESSRKRLADLLAAAEEFKIGDASAVATFLAFVIWNTHFFVETVENLNYKTADRLKAVFPSSFRSIEDAQSVVGFPEQIANRVYNGRLGNSEPGDGWRYRGRGYMGTAGRGAYDSSARVIGVDLVSNPDALVESSVAAREAAARFARLTGEERRSMALAARRINGGNMGLAEGQAILERLVPQAPKVTEGLTITSDSPGGSSPR